MVIEGPAGRRPEEAAGINAPEVRFEADPAYEHLPTGQSTPVELRGPFKREQEVFFEEASNFQVVAAGKEREALLRVADRLCAALGFGDDGRVGEETKLPLDGHEKGLTGGLSAEDERLVMSLRGSLMRIVGAAGLETSDEGSKRAALAALDGAELVMRGELARENAALVGAQLPSFVFLVTLPVVGQDDAITLSRRTSALVGAALRSARDQ